MSEIWKMIDGHPNYRISNYGKVFSVKMQKTLKWNLAKEVRPRVNLNGKYYYVHQLVAYSFLGPRPEGKIVCHKDDNTLNNYVGNLYYGTIKENAIDRSVNGKGRKLTNDDVIEIRRRVKKGEPQKLIAADYEISNRTVCSIKKGKLYGWLKDDGTIKEKENTEMKEELTKTEMKEEIIKIILDYPEICEELIKIVQLIKEQRVPNQINRIKEI